MIAEQPRIREIPYNYTSFSDREIIIRFLGQEMWDILNQLRQQRRTGRSARLLMEVLGDIWIADRNPFIQDELLGNDKRLQNLLTTLHQRLTQIEAWMDGNKLVEKLLEQTKKTVTQFANAFPRHRELRKKLHRALARITSKENIDFSGIARVAHVTDATDWRVEYPFAVITPNNEQEIARLVNACIQLGLSIIPRGGGTGYTGSAIPLDAYTVVINTEKLDAIHAIEKRTIPGHETAVAVIHAQAGAITKRVADKAKDTSPKDTDYIFSVDPTSQNASTIGGNIAMNAGGKKAVLWGTTLDNLVSWKMVTPQAEWLTVERLNHNFGKIHDIPEAKFRVSRYQMDGKTPVGKPKTLTIAREEIRKPGLGKDVTNKFLGGLPGVQKEGCDGIITSATFLVHRIPPHIYTVCMEFFGANLSRAVPAIVETKEYLDNHNHVGCAGLEHLDERYIRAVGYSSKALHRQQPKMVLLADIIGDDKSQVEEAANHIVALTQARDGEGFIAISHEARARFWSDRSRTAAIAAHTNAFKINEDVVIPLEQLARYSEQIERINIEYSTKNKIAILNALHTFFSTQQFQKFLPQGYPNSDESRTIIKAKTEEALRIVETVRQRWQTFQTHFEQPVQSVIQELLPSTKEAIQEGDTLIDLLLRRDLRISYKSAVRNKLSDLFNGELWEDLRQELTNIHHRVRSSRLFVALHMHAGDGNIHTNIPVNSNDYHMLLEAEKIVHRVMKLALDLGGAISGEHGVGLTKYQFLDQDKREAFEKYKQKVDPENRFNPGKLLPGKSLEQAYTPSLRLVQQEALIFQASELGALNDAIKNCLRCGKCKPVCTTHAPRANHYYPPRNKILAAGMMIEAFLYEEQTRRRLVERHLDAFNDLADHCTICHRCLTPCPVNIDFGKVTMRLREILKERGQRKTAITADLAMKFLTLNHSGAIRYTRHILLKPGYLAQRLGHSLLRLSTGSHTVPTPSGTEERPKLIDNLRHIMAAPLPGPLPAKTARDALQLTFRPDAIPIIKPRHSRQDTRDRGTESVFYFPGCGCERLFSDIALAVIALLRHQGIQTVLPPGFICCGFPQAASGNNELGNEITTENRVLFHRAAMTLEYLKIKNVVVSCGTCMEQLTHYQFDQIFPSSQLIDVHEFLHSKGFTNPKTNPEARRLFHDPCHSPSRHHDPVTLSDKLLGGTTLLADRCCGEAGLFALNRPDIATQARFRKASELSRNLEKLYRDQEQTADTKTTKILTTCPSCYQGLSRYQSSQPVQVDFLAVELARQILGENWKKETLAEIYDGGVETVLF
ncbi:DUF3683 domain-containing protein [Magnetococcales bacterium HHB-1]